MTMDIGHLTFQELIDLNHRIIDRLKVLELANTHDAMTAFRLGERVTFHPDGHDVIFGFISRLNQKTITILSEDGHKWRVAPQLVSKASASSDQPVDTDNVVLLKSPNSPK